MLVAETGRVTPAPDALHVEQVGWGVARQVARSVAASRGDAPALLEDLVRLAEAPGFLAYAVLEGRSALGVGLVSLPGAPDAAASYVGDVVVPGSDLPVRATMLVRALHDVARAGFTRLVVDEASLEPDGTPWEALGFAPLDPVDPGR
ncbi:MAG: hypothetical protein JWR20_108 [Marmoricola sp.]|nr:hypothetical protein [Marmoricola sp.]